MKISKLADMMSAKYALLCLSLLAARVAALGLTDTITWGGDNSRTGYQINHNMDPSVVGSSQFGQIFKTPLPGNYAGAKEQIFSQPLLYTSDTDKVQYMYIATTQNNIYKVDAKTGAILLSRNLHIPFLAADLDGCVDINPHVGITATGVIDPSTDTWYLTSKTYLDETKTGIQGKPNGRYYFHAINVNDLSEREGFPTSHEGQLARNNPNKPFQAGIHHARPGMLQTGNWVYGGFASHCAQYNFTGWIVGWDKTTGAVVENYAMEGAGVGANIDGGGVWMSGGGIASDDRGSIFFSTGNGHASQLSTIPVAGRNPPTSLEQAAVHMTINDDGSLNVVDFFMPWEKPQLDGADKDLGTTPLQILPSQFGCGDVRRIGVVTGKSGKTYWLNLDNMGGYRNGPDGLDAVLQVYQNENSVYAGAGVYPLEGGYIYINVIQYPSHVFKFSCTAGVPSFTKVADSPEKNAYILGVGHGTVTSLNDRPGTGLVWTSDVQGENLRVYNAVPQNGLLTKIAKFNAPGITKFTRPVFGDGRAYLGTNNGFLYGFGAPVNLPLNCTGADFGISDIGVPTASQTITCSANVGVQVVNVTLGEARDFSLSGIDTLPVTVAAGGTFTFQATFNPQVVGVLSSDILIGTVNTVAGYSTGTPVSLKGTGQSVNALLGLSPPVLAFQGIITGETVGGVNQSALFSNQGNTPLTISSIEYSIVSESGPYIPANGTASTPIVGPFIFFGIPSTIPANTVQTVNINFDSPTSGNFAAYLKITSNGGTKYFSTVGTSGAAPVALVEFQTLDGSGWIPYSNSTPFTFGNVTQNQARYLQMRLTNTGPELSARLSITISKAPFGGTTIINANNQVDLGEGVSLGPGESATAVLSCAVPKSQVNVDPYTQTAAWSMNLNDPAFGKQAIGFTCTAVAEQYAPFAANGNGTGVYRYKGCYQGSAPGGKLKTRIYSSANNTNGMCMAACAAKAERWQFAGTEYHSECWCGDVMPPLMVSEDHCNFDCSGNINQICGGNGIRTNSGSFFSLFVDTSRGDTPLPPPTSGPFANPGVDGYVSQGCYKEATAGRALAIGKSISANATVYNCIQACKGYTYAGVEYGQECYCGNSLGVGSVPTLASECNTPCKGNASEYCGAGSRLNLYASGLGGGPDSSVVSSATVSSSSSVPGETSISMSPSPSTTVSSSSERPSSSSLAGTAGTPSTTSSSSAPPSSSSSGSMISTPGMPPLTPSTSSSESMISTPGMPPLMPSTSTSGRLTSTPGMPPTPSTLSTTSLVPTPTATSGPWEPLGCFSEVAGRTLRDAATSSNFMTRALCQDFCASKNLQFAGVEYGRECYCGSAIYSYPATSGCVMPCAGFAAEICGGSNRLNVFNNTAFMPPGLVQKVGEYELQGCYAEPTTGRAITGYMFANSTAMRPQLCVDACASRGYAVAGIEYGQECWCGNSLASGASKVEDVRCNFPCPGARMEWCGAGGTLAVYRDA